MWHKQYQDSTIKELGYNSDLWVCVMKHGQSETTYGSYTKTTTSHANWDPAELTGL